MSDYYNGPIWNSFGLTRAAYFVAPRRALQSMPVDWQEQFVVLMEQAYEQLGSEAFGEYSVQAREGGRFVKDWRADYRHAGPMPGKPA